jgi:hypothetical protein
MQLKPHLLYGKTRSMLVSFEEQNTVFCTLKKTILRAIFARVLSYSYTLAKIDLS